MIKDDASAIDRLVEELVATIGERRYQTWFDSRVTLRLMDRDTEEHTIGNDATNGAVLLTVGSPLERDCVQRQFGDALRSACLRAGLGERRINYRIEATSTAPAPVATPSVTIRSHAAPADVQAALPADDEAAGESAFTRFVTGPGNMTAADIARRVARGERVASPLLLWGPTGVGKTHLLQAMREEGRRCRRRARVILLTAEQFTTGFVTAVHTRGLPRFRNKHRGVDLLLLDDLQFFIGKQKTLEELQHTFDTLLAAGAQIVVASDRSPAELHDLGGEIASRLGAGVSIGLQPADGATRRKMLDKIVRRESLAINASVLDLIAANVTGGARELGGVMNRLRISQQLLGEPIDEAAARKVIAETNRQTTPRVKLADIQTAVCHVFGLDKASLKSNKRTKATTEPRMLAMWLSRKYTGAAWSEIGQYYGRRSHSTVISACRRVEKLMARDEQKTLAGFDHPLQEALRQVEAELRTA